MVDKVDLEHSQYLNGALGNSSYLLQIVNIVGKGSILNIYKGHRFASKYVTLVLNVHSCSDEEKKKIQF